jgi:selenocysteine lyase/cysteine desulfurase
MNEVTQENSRPTPIALPAKADFAPMQLAYLDSATMHPIALGAKAAVESYLDARTFSGDGRGYFAGTTEQKVLRYFARLINASAEEVCFVPSTTAAEHLVLTSLGLPAAGGRVVTDTLHFPGSFYLYDEISKLGVDVVWLTASEEGRVELDAIESAITPNTKLIAVSLVSSVNGFRHDLKRVCEIAHARGAYVYADVIHAAGCSPVDVKDSGVDFAACSGFKWLMGDFGLGFLYVRADLLDRLQKTQFGYYQLAAFRTPDFPVGPPRGEFGGYAVANGAIGMFALGTIAHAALVQLEWSLQYIFDLGVARIERHRQALTDHLKNELPEMGFRLLTPIESPGPIVSCALAEAHSLAPRLAAAQVRIALAPGRFRISPSVFNDLSDVDRLLSALSGLRRHERVG